MLNANIHAGENVTCNFLVAPTVKEGGIYAIIGIDDAVKEIKLPVTILEPGMNYVFNITVKKDTSLVLGEVWIVNRDEKSSSSMDWEIEY